MRLKCLCVFLLWATVGCGADFDDPNNNGFFNNGNNQNNANNQNNGTGGVDYCEIFGWYNDGSCDEICVNPDPDCGNVDCRDDYPSNYEFVSNDPNECAALDFICADGSSYFSNDCGCGCVSDVGPVCPDPNDPEVEYIGGSEDDPEICELIDFACVNGREPFYIPECGCGCIGTEYCIELHNDPSRDYVSTDAEECRSIRFTCADDAEPFYDECGCGCASPGFCPDERDPNVIYFSRDEEECSQETLGGIGEDGSEIAPNCPPNSEHFFIPECGCGCIVSDIICEYNDPDTVWFGTSPDECAFDGNDGFCPPDMVWFENECGCGCAGYCPDPTDPTVHYYGNSQNECALIDFGCGLNQDYFDSACGCGCIDNCPDPNDPDVIYISQDPNECNVLGAFACPTGFDGFYDSCGCGCKRTDECFDDTDCINGYCAITQNGGVCIYPECGDGSEVLCDAIPPVCPAGMAPSVQNGCWGPCVDARSCLMIVPG